MIYAANVIDGNDQNSMTHAAYAIELKKLISISFLYKAFFKYLEVQEMLVIVCAQQSNYVIKLYIHTMEKQGIITNCFPIIYTNLYSL